MRTLIYLDESGDLGWTLDKPYKKGGSSRILTLSAICIPDEKIKLVERIVRSLYKKRKRPLSNELKSVDLNLADKELFIEQTSKLLGNHNDIFLLSISVEKKLVPTRLKEDPNTLYNYMIKKLLLDTICQYEYVDFIPDRRSEKVNAKWNMTEYLNQMLLEKELEVGITNKSCNITPMDSSKYLPLQFIDFYTGLVWAKYEFENNQVDKLLAYSSVRDFKLFQ